MGTSEDADRFVLFCFVFSFPPSLFGMQVYPLPDACNLWVSSLKGVRQSPIRCSGTQTACIPESPPGTSLYAVGMGASGGKDGVE